jgi:hypothetical protein
MEVLKLRQQLASKQTYTERLEFLLHERMTRIDELNVKIEAKRTLGRPLLITSLLPEQSRNSIPIFPE